MLERHFIDIFGKKFFNIILFNCVLASVTAVFLYWIGKLVFEDERQAIAAGFLYCFMPTNIMQCATATQEILVIACN